MELVYLWVEEYKNIHRQGFNFSPRFECKYENNELTICDKKKKECKDNDYIENFFGDNINVTAIVGKNGSGKSSILKLIMMLIFYNKHTTLPHESLLNDDKELYIACESIFNSYEEVELFCIIKNKERFINLSISNKIKCIKYNGEVIKIQNMFNENINFFTIHFNYMLDTLYDGGNDGWVKSIYHKADRYDNPLLLEPYKNNNHKQVIDLEIIEYLNNQNMLEFYSNVTDNSYIDFFRPNKIIFFMKKRINQYSFLIDEEFIKAHISNLFDLYTKGKNIKFLIFKYFQLKHKIKGSLNSEDLLVASKIDSLYDNGKFKELNKIYIAFKVLSSDESLFNKRIYNDIYNWFDGIDEDFNIDDLVYDKLLNSNNPEYEIGKIKVCLDFDKNKIYENNIFKDAIGYTKKIDEVKTILSFLPAWLEVVWFEDNKSIKSLSSGEKSFFTFIINLMYQIQNINNEPKYDTINLFLDETELGFHPQWHKEYLNNILEAIKKINKKKINIIFATHSPFLISDLPKENVMFLKDGLQDKGIKHKQTFGQNIHTLLSDSFFMEGGLMGEFAKNKIQEIMDFLNNKKTIEEISTKEEHIKKVIETIGEPFLKEKLLKMYDKKYPKTNEEKIAELQKQIDELR